MSMGCADIVDRLPDWVAGRLAAGEADGVAAHVRGCADCTAESELLRGLVATRPAVPADLASRIVAAARASDALAAPAASSVRPLRPRRAWSVRPAWALTAAAALVLAVGTTVVSRRAAEPVGEMAVRAPVSPVAAVLGEVPVPEEGSVQNAVWISDDAEVAGAPVLDDLSDESLAALLEEMGG